MQLPVFENAYLLESIGWAIANSFWQAGFLWIIYKLITGIDKKLPALVKHNLGVILLTTSTLWFTFTLVQNYRLLSGLSTSREIINTGIVITSYPFLGTIFPFFSVIYLVLLCFYSFRFYKSLSANHDLQTDGLIKAPIDYRLFTSQAALRLGIKKGVGVWLTRNVEVPSVTGFLKPVILLPAAIISHLSTQQIEAILLHELAHIKRNDYLVNLIQSIIELVLFFNPFVQLLIREANKERENCCDDWVMNFKYDRREYSNALMILEEQRHQLLYRFALAATNDKRNLLRRIKRLFDTTPQTNVTSTQKFKLIALCCLLVPVLIGVLPQMKNKSSIEPIIGDNNPSNKNEKAKLVSSDKFPQENYSTTKFISSPKISGNDKIRVSPRNRQKSRQLKKQEGEYFNAYINEELISPNASSESVISQVAEKELNNSKLYITVEEQQSGKKQTNTYYFELNTLEGIESIKPLIILNKYKALEKTRIPANIPDSVYTSKKRPLTKKRITS